MKLLLDGIEAALHQTVPAKVHRRYEPGECPHCPALKNIRASMEHRTKDVLKHLSAQRPQGS